MSKLGLMDKSHTPWESDKHDTAWQVGYGDNGAGVCWWIGAYVFDMFDAFVLDLFGTQCLSSVFHRHLGSLPSFIVLVSACICRLSRSVLIGYCQTL